MSNKPTETITSVKGFGLDMKCSDFQFEVGKTYTHDGEVKACSGGFHACEYPLDVFNHYAPGQSKYAIVTQSGNISRDSGDTKIASGKITVEAEIKIPDLVARAVAWVIAKATLANVKHSEGYQSAASSTGDESAASSTGYQSAASSTGDRSAASSTGDQSAASSTGDRSAATSSGKFGRVMAAEGCAMFLVYRGDNWDIEHAWAGIAGRDGIKPLVWYTLNNDGQPVEVV